MKWEFATKRQLLQIALFEDCDNELKFESVKELQSRWSQDMLTDVVVMYGKGYLPEEIAEYLGTSTQVISGVISKYKLKKVKGA